MNACQEIVHPPKSKLSEAAPSFRLKCPLLRALLDI